MEVGESVTFEFTSADATTAGAVTLYDANRVARPLQAWERLVVDEVGCAAAAAVLLTDVFVDLTGNGNVDAGERIASFAPSDGDRLFPGENHSLPVGKVPSVKSTVAGNVRVVGCARITQGQTQGVRPGWRGKELGNA